ncbi:hypothetical protein ACS0TY_028777 [Phlomoides rotata]
MAARVATYQKSKPLVFERIEKDTGGVLSPKSTLNLMQNCDLPPPIKLFSGHEGILLSSISKIYSMGGVEVENEHIRMDEDDKLEILKALRLSQTRAREAERKVRVVSEEKNTLSNLIVDETMRVYAHRLWINMLEFEVMKLQIQQKENTESYNSSCNCDESNSSQKWCTAIAFCLAIAGMSFAFGCTYVF